MKKNMWNPTGRGNSLCLRNTCWACLLPRVERGKSQCEKWFCCWDEFKKDTAMTKPRNGLGNHGPRWLLLAPSCRDKIWRESSCISPHRGKLWNFGWHFFGSKRRKHFRNWTGISQVSTETKCWFCVSWELKGYTWSSSQFPCGWWNND